MQTAGSVTLFTDQPSHSLIVNAGFSDVRQQQPHKIASVPHPFAAPLFARVQAMR